MLMFNLFTFCPFISLTSSPGRTPLEVSLYADEYAAKQTDRRGESPSRMLKNYSHFHSVSW